MSGVALMSRRVVAVIVTVGLGTFILGLVLSAFASDLFETSSAGHDTESRSFVGYHALRTVLERVGFHVVIARGTETTQPGPRFPLLLLEPFAMDGGPESEFDLRLPNVADEAVNRVAQARKIGAPVVLVARKRQVVVGHTITGWVAEEHLMPVEDAGEPIADVILAETGEGAGAEPRVEAGASALLLRPDELGRCSAKALGMDEVTVELEDPQLFVPAEAYEPLVACESGVLVAQLAGDPSVILVSDPDWLANRGLVRGDHAELIARLLAEHLGAEGVVIDDTIHGYEQRPSLLRAALSFPLVLVVLHVALLLALLGWSVSIRWGAPLPPPSALPPGKRLLIENTTNLLASSGAHADALQRYLHMTMAWVARDASMSEGIGTDGLRERLRALGRARGVDEDLDTLINTVNQQPSSHGEILRLARRIDEWRRAVTGRDLG